MAFDHFDEILKTSRSDQNIHWPKYMNPIRGFLSAGSIKILNEPFAAQEVKEALFQINPTKVPVPDGFSALFFQKCWHIVGSEITQRTLSMLNQGKLEEGINETVTTLVPKIKQVTSLNDCRPISLCNVVYKTISKVLSNRLKLILNEIISEFQSAFITGRLIFDNFLLTHELSYFIRSRRNQIVG